MSHRRLMRRSGRGGRPPRRGRGGFVSVGFLAPARPSWQRSLIPVSAHRSRQRQVERACARSPRPSSDVNGQWIPRLSARPRAPGPVEVHGVGDVELGLEAHRAGEVDVLVMRRSHGAGRRRGSRPPGPRPGPTDGQLEPLDRLGDEAVELRGADASGDRSDLRVHEGGCLAAQRGSRVDRDLSDGPRSPRGHCTVWTCDHTLGRRWRSSSAWPMSFFADVVEMPRTAPSSARQNSATSGHPSPAMGSSCSGPRA